MNDDQAISEEDNAQMIGDALVDELSDWANDAIQQGNIPLAANRR
jgi:hypothetical protein